MCQGIIEGTKTQLSLEPEFPIAKGQLDSNVVIPTLFPAGAAAAKEEPLLPVVLVALDVAGEPREQVPPTAALVSRPVRRGACEVHR